jgi:hypothetical protein
MAMRSLDIFTVQYVLLSGRPDNESLVGEVRLKNQQISLLENQIAVNKVRNEFLLSEIIRINETSTLILLNTIWTLAVEPRN